jgi:hypothetical protein
MYYIRNYIELFPLPLVELACASSPVGREFAASPSIITYISENSLTMLIGKKVGKVNPGSLAKAFFAKA